MATRTERARALLEQPLKKGRGWASLSYSYDYTPKEDAMYLGWYDDNTKKDATAKAQEAIAAYRARFESEPNVLLVNEADRLIEVKGVAVRVANYVQKNNYHVGFEYGYGVQP